MKIQTTLRVLYDLVKDSPNPTQFACRPAEIITHHDQPWDIILSHLEALAAANLISFTSPVTITITQKGLDYFSQEDKVSGGISYSEKPA